MIDFMHLHVHTYQLQLLWLVTWKCHWLENIREFVALARNGNETSRLQPFPWKESVWQNPDHGKLNQDVWNYLKTTLPYNKLLNEQ